MPPTADSDPPPERCRRRAAADLGWPRLLAAIAEGCAGDEARARLLALQPATSLHEAQARMRLTAAALSALETGEPVPAPAAPALGSVLDRVDRGSDASAEELAAVGTLLSAARRLRAYARARQRALPLLGDALDSPADLDALAERLERSVDPTGRVLDGASRALRDGRQRARALRQELGTTLERLAARHADVLRDSGAVERDGRHGLPVRADAHRRVEGIVLGASASGATVYVEPPAVTAVSNHLKIVEAEIEREQARVLAALSHDVRQAGEAVRTAHEACVQADLLAALSGWAVRAQAVAIEPDGAPRIELERARHPLLMLQQRPVVPNDISARSGQALVISGPNAGGKTVALKCLGLAVWMAASGVPLPVDASSRVGWLWPVLTDMGDQQSIASSLSTFSAEITTLTEILERADTGSLVLLDELVDGTDPEQGGALAAAVLERLIEAGAAVVVTTHYARLKELAAADGRFVNAAMRFDFEHGGPTFELVTGAAGASSALLVAARHGLPAAVVARARALQSEAARRHEALLAELDVERRALVEAREQAEARTVAAADLEQRLEQQRQDVRAKERRKLGREAAALRGQVREARAALAQATATLGGAHTKAELREAGRKVDAAAQVVAAGSPLAQAERPAEPAPRRLEIGELVAGTRVHLTKLGTTGVLIGPPERNRARVRAGAFTLTVPVAELRLAAPAAPERRRAAMASPEREPRVRHQPAAGADEAKPIRTSINTCDLRGMRAEEALEALDRFIDGCVSAGEPVVFALHGHGTGALKRAVREHAALSMQVACARPAALDEGGDAFTALWLR